MFALLMPTSASLETIIVFINFSSFEFTLAMFKFVDGMSTRSKLGIYLRHLQIKIHPFNSPFNWKAFKLGIWTPLKFVWPRGLS
jgi:hypothetical protein